MMKLSETVLEFDKTLWVQYGGGVEIEDKGSTLALTGREEEAYLKVLNHFGRVMKLYTFDDGRWMDAETGLSATPFDETMAGRLPHPVNIPAGLSGIKVKGAKAGKDGKAGSKGAPRAAKTKPAQAGKATKTTKPPAKKAVTAKAGAKPKPAAKAGGAAKSSQGKPGGTKPGKSAKVK